MDVGTCVYVRAHVSAHIHTHTPVGAPRSQHRVSYDSCLEFTIASDEAQVRQQERQMHSFTHGLPGHTPAVFRALCAAGLDATVVIVLAGD